QYQGILIPCFCSDHLFPFILKLLPNNHSLICFHFLFASDFERVWPCFSVEAVHSRSTCWIHILLGR
uniref:Uncharacterized protein n=1 Tax=Aegilops tauschii subsp. strangulata TaxID=200361 RepID=A0A453FKF7_AEGTS